MSKWSCRALLLAMVMLAVPGCVAGKKDGTQAATPLDVQLQGIVDSDPYQLSALSVAVVKSGEIVFAKGYGSAFVNSDNPKLALAADADTKYRIASISKTGVAIAIMQLVDQGKLQLDADVSTYLGWKLQNPDTKQAITIRMLLSHTSSLRDSSGYNKKPGEDLKDYIARNGAKREKDRFAKTVPGQYFAYENVNYVVLGMIIEKLSGMRFDAYMSKYVLEPLGIKGAYSPYLLDDDSLAKLGTLYRKRNKEGVWNPKGDWVAQHDAVHQVVDGAVVHVRPKDLYAGVTYVPGTMPSLMGPQGGLRISANDLAKIMILLMNGGVYDGKRLLSEESVAAMLTPAWTYDKAAKNGRPGYDRYTPPAYDGLITAYGLGVHVLQSGNGDTLVQGETLRWVGHMGDAYGLYSAMWFDPKTQNGIIYLIGGSGDNPEKYPGAYSAFYLKEEQLLTALYTHFFK